MRKQLAVLYVFHEFHDRVKHFLENCIFYDENIDWYVISNDKSNVFSAPKYVKVIFRDNLGFDFGGWSDALIKYGLYSQYEKFIFCNSSIIGPFIPSYCKMKWTDIYLDGLKDNIKIFGSTINTTPVPTENAHVQSYIFAIDYKTAEFLIKAEIFSITNYAEVFDDAIYKKEVPMSRKIIEAGGNIGCLVNYYNGIDFTFRDKKPSDYRKRFTFDVMQPEMRGVLWTEHDLVFVKGNRISIPLVNCRRCTNT